MNKYKIGEELLIGDTLHLYITDILHSQYGCLITDLTDGYTFQKYYFTFEEIDSAKDIRPMTKLEKVLR